MEADASIFGNGVINVDFDRIVVMLRQWLGRRQSVRIAVLMVCIVVMVPVMIVVVTVMMSAMMHFRFVAFVT